MPCLFLGVLGKKGSRRVGGGSRGGAKGDRCTEFWMVVRELLVAEPRHCDRAWAALAKGSVIEENGFESNSAVVGSQTLG